MPTTTIQPISAPQLRPELAAAAGYLGLTRPELRARLLAGATLSRLAVDRGRSVHGLLATMLAPVRARLDGAVAAGRLTALERDDIVDDLRDRIETAVDVDIPFPAAETSGEEIQRRPQVEPAPVRAIGRHHVLAAPASVQLVGDELGAHHSARLALVEAEAPADADTALECIALRHPLVAHAAEVPGLVGEDSDRAGRAAERIDLSVRGEPLEREAELGREVGEVAADDGHAVRVLDASDDLPGRVASHPHRLSRDARRLGGESRFRRGTGLPGEILPTAAVEEEEEAGDEGEHDRGFCDGPCEAAPWLRGRRHGARRGRLLVRPLGGVDPEALALDLDDLPLGDVARPVPLSVGGVGPSVGCAEERLGAPDVRQDEVRLEGERDHEREPQRHRVAHGGRAEQPGGEQDRERDPQAAHEREQACRRHGLRVGSPA
jgi:hypothetical protein